MNPIVRNILAVIAGLVLGNIVNMATTATGRAVVPAPGGADLTTVEGWQAAMPLLQPKHFAFPFLAHVLGTFAGAFLAAKLAVSHKMKFALGLGVVFLLGGVTASFLIPAPLWFKALDLVVAYLPMSYVAGQFATKDSR